MDTWRTSGQKAGVAEGVLRVAALAEDGELNLSSSAAVAAWPTLFAAATSVGVSQKPVAY